jgi:hypothetical protein
MAFIVVVEDLVEHRYKVSQEGYKTLREAQAFIRSRSGLVQRLDNYIYLENYKTMYTIHEVTIK